MLRVNSRLSLLLLLILLCVVAPVAAAPSPDLTATISHLGDTGIGNRDFTAGGSGTVSVAIQNVGDADTTGDTTVTMTLAGGLVYDGSPITSSPNGYFTTCGGTTTVTCTTSSVIPSTFMETITIGVTAPGTTGTGFVNQAQVSTVSDVDNTNDTASDPTPFDVIAPTVIAPTVDLAVSSVSHVGTSGVNFVVNSTTGTVAVTMTNLGSAASSGTITLVIFLGGGLTFNSFVTSAWFAPADCLGVGTSTVTCTSTISVVPAAADTLTITVKAPGSPAGGPDSPTRRPFRWRATAPLATIPTATFTASKSCWREPTRRPLRPLPS